MLTSYCTVQVHRHVRTCNTNPKYIKINLNNVKYTINIVFTHPLYIKNPLTRPNPTPTQP